ncbi:hypothetical protein [Dinghuibacter silviterrae]|uniref:NERD domain-containing protein n=1 Tax=Dinghuibacter silviterrae TaxID=1539049 RepID=A0A4R8DQM3_9BACT|nr:hypothetical protein [Dinghuibacter silviterrae]TDX00454.1 hypothetical protein EDB95_1479 [Dinghuibacter silviterrae]
MAEPFFIPDEWRERYKYAFEQARQNMPFYQEWIKNEIEAAITMINSFDKVAVIGGLAAKLIRATPTLYNTFLKGYDGDDKNEAEKDQLQEDDNIEVLLEYVMNLATATANDKKGVLPSAVDIESIYQQLLKIKFNINFGEMASDPPPGTMEEDQWIKNMVVADTLNVRGQGYYSHVKELYHEVFTPHNGFLKQYYGFDAMDLLDTVLKLDALVFSKIGNPEGMFVWTKRFERWGKAKGYDRPGNFFPVPYHHREFLKENPDLQDPGSPQSMSLCSLDSIPSFSRLFWVIPEDEKEKKIFDQLSISFGGNGIFLSVPKFKGFPQGDTELRRRPIIKEDGKFYHFSLNFAFRNIFIIAEDLIREADSVYYDTYYRNNAQSTTKDRQVELKTKSVFEQLLPDARFYHSLKYDTVENGIEKKNELDILGVSDEALYIIEVKAGEYNTKIRRGAMKGLKDKLEETVGKGSQQCHRALQFIKDELSPIFTYAKGGASHTLKIDKSVEKNIYRITVTYEQLSVVGLELQNLIASGVIDKNYRGAWIVSLYDLMTFRDLIENEKDFKEYLDYRLGLYDRTDLSFMDEIAVLGFYFDGGFPLGPVNPDQKITMVGYDEDINDYYTKRDLAWPNLQKPKKKTDS